MQFIIRYHKNHLTKFALVIFDLQDTAKANIGSYVTRSNNTEDQKIEKQILKYL